MKRLFAGWVDPTGARLPQNFLPDAWASKQHTEVLKPHGTHCGRRPAQR